MFTTPSSKLAPVLAHSFHTATPWREGIFAVDSVHGGGTKEYVACGDFPRWVTEGLVALEQDEHAYEILPEGRAVYPYLDIEFDAEQLDAEDVLSTVIYSALVCLQRMGCTTVNGISVFTASGACGGRIASGQKGSFHVVFETHEVFRSTMDHRIFVQHVLMPYLKEDEERIRALTWTTTKEEKMFAVDAVPYMRNQAFRLPYQSKRGSNRPLVPYDITALGYPSSSLWTVGVYEPFDSIIYLDSERMEKEITGQGKGQGQRVTVTSDKLSNEYDLVVALANELSADFLTRYQETRDLVWCLWAVEQTPRMRGFIHTLCERGKNYDARWVEGLLRTWRYAALSIGSLVRWVKEEKGASVVRRIIQANPIQYHRELFETTIMPVNHIQVSCRYLGKVKEMDFSPKDTADTLLVKSHLGTGKTVAITNIIRLGTYQRILILSPRKSYTYAQMGIFASDPTLPPFVSYLDQHPGFLSEVPYLIVQLESIHKVFHYFEPYDLVIMDEAESILNQLHSITTNGKHLINNHSTLEKVIRTAGRVIMADAFLSDRTMNIARSLRSGDRTRYIENTFQPYARTAVYLREASPSVPLPLPIGKRKEKVANEEVKEVKEEVEESGIIPAHLYGFCQRIMTALRAGRRIVVLWTSKRKGDWFVRSFLKDTEFAYCFYSSDTTKEEQLGLRDVHSTWSQLQCLMMTTSITVGISYDPDEPEIQFDEAFLYGSNTTAMPRDIAQALLRVRVLKTQRLTYVMDVRPTSNDYDTTRGFKNVWGQLTAKEIACIRDHPLIEWYDCPDWAKWNHVYNENEERCSRVEYVDILEKYLSLCGYEQIEEVERVEETFVIAHPGGGEDNELAWEDIHFLTDEQAEALRAQMVRGDGMDTEDRLRLKKWAFQSVLERGAPMAAQAMIWQEYIEKRHDGRFWNARMERWWSLEAMADEESRKRYAIMSTDQLRRRKALRSFLEAVGMRYSLEERVMEHEELVGLGPRLEAIQMEVRQGLGLRPTRRQGETWSVSHSVDFIHAVIENWSGGYVEIITKAKKINKKTVRIFTVDLNRGHPLWFMFRQAGWETDECLIKL
jgi:hypothetical protein